MEELEVQLHQHQVLLQLVIPHIGLVKKIRLSQSKLREFSAVKANNHISPLEIFVIVLITSNLLCWFPYIAAIGYNLSGNSIKESLFSWLVIIVAPISATLNPVLFKVLSASVRRKVMKWFKEIDLVSLK